ncbi:sugar transferase [Falsigemmobacter faecalis]|uniref:Sugar transferase n=1 Tax=Falsigemmobacter faecalis TaxID=2488730 RepID=A0A3P3DTX4_9RHOB|nr:sugar transferase [Falsigemmobacter faecalis]RRH76912.1 sugar transferase [Falsigemmobacter faecalis]
MQVSASLYQRVFRRVFDLILLALALPFLLPLILVLVVMIRLDSPGPAFLRLSRRGQDGKIFRQLRFRCVWLDAPLRAFQATSGTPDDPRLTRVGVFVMRTRLNTLPMIFNALGGSMSLVGPRALPVDVTGFDPEVVRLVSQMRPGIFTPDSLTAESADDLSRLAITLAWMRNAGPLGDLRIVLRGVTGI